MTTYTALPQVVKTASDISLQTDGDYVITFPSTAYLKDQFSDSAFDSCPTFGVSPQGEALYPTTGLVFFRTTTAVGLVPTHGLTPATTDGAIVAVLWRHRTDQNSSTAMSVRRAILINGASAGLGELGFSMIEVALAIGVTGFCLLAVVGLLPTGVSGQRSAQEQARATSALKVVTAALESLRFTARDGGGNATWAFPRYFSDNPDPATNPTLVWVTQAPWTYTFSVSDGGTIIATDDTTSTRRQTLYVKVYPPAIEGRPVQIYAAVAWPYKPTDTSTTTPQQMAGREGFLDSFVAFTPKTSN